MMMMNFGMVFLMTMLMGGVSDMLDVIPSDEYWRIKNVQVSEATLTADLAPPQPAGDIAGLVDHLGEGDPAVREAAAGKIRAMGPGAVPQLQKATESDNPEIAARARKLIADIQNGGKAQQVRRLMAIRTAGERKMVALLPRLKELAASQEMFVADYAAAAVAAIEGKAYSRPQSVLADDVWKMPADVRAVVHVSVRGQRVATMDDLNKLTVMMRPGGNIEPEQGRQMLDQMMRKIVEIVDQTGNVRLEGITFGLSDHVGNRSGYVIAMVHAQYDRAAVANLIAQANGAKSQAIGGIDTIELQREFTLLFPTDRKMVVIGGPAESPKPLEAVAEAFRGNQAPLKQSPDMVKLLADVDTKQPMWGAVHVTDNYRQAPLLASLSTIRLSGKAEGEALDFRFDVTGQNEAGVREAVGMVTNGVAQAKAMLQQLNQVPPEAEMGMLKDAITTATKLMDSIKVSVDAGDATRAQMTGRLESPPQMLMAMFFGFASVGPPMAPPPPVPGAVEDAPAVREEVKPDVRPQPQPQ